MRRKTVFEILLITRVSYLSSKHCEPSLWARRLEAGQFFVKVCCMLGEMKNLAVVCSMENNFGKEVPGGNINLALIIIDWQVPLSPFRLLGRSSSGSLDQSHHSGAVQRSRITENLQSNACWLLVVGSQGGQWTPWLPPAPGELGRISTGLKGELYYKIFTKRALERINILNGSAVSPSQTLAFPIQQRDYAKLHSFSSNLLPAIQWVMCDYK